MSWPRPTVPATWSPWTPTGRTIRPRWASLLRPVLDGEADFVIASRRLGVDQTTDRFRRAGVTLYASILNGITAQTLTDSSNGYRAFRVELLEDIVPLLVEDQYQTAEVVITASSRGWRITERPTVWHPRASGTLQEGRQPLLRPAVRPGHRGLVVPVPPGQPRAAARPLRDLPPVLGPGPGPSGVADPTQYRPVTATERS